MVRRRKSFKNTFAHVILMFLSLVWVPSLLVLMSSLLVVMSPVFLFLANVAANWDALRSPTVLVTESAVTSRAAKALPWAMIVSVLPVSKSTLLCN